MNRQKGFSTTAVIVVLVLLVALALAGYYFYNNWGQLNQYTTSTPINKTYTAPKTADDTSSQTLDQDLSAQESMDLQTDDADLSALDKDLSQL